MKPKPFVSYGPGHSGDWDTVTEAQVAVKKGGGAVYFRLSIAAHSQIMKLEAENADLKHRVEAYEAQFRGMGITTYLDRMKEQAARIEARERVFRAAQAEWAFRVWPAGIPDTGRDVVGQEFENAVVDATLIEAGYDPAQVAKDMAELAWTAITAAQDQES